ncbi:kinesin-like protein KIF25 isoform X1 [Lepisosteus oculatus]|uniref:kinesin-like protein KIF25 isoform X1 n=1 Tax=Lepisosteus oculatus TaxID=7918 RepID=UPI0035F52640
MPLYINPDRVSALRVSLLEHKLRSKEERIVELETEKALLHLKLAECYGKFRRDNGRQGQILYQNTQTFLEKIFIEVQALKKSLRDLYRTYVGFSAELEQRSRCFLDQVNRASERIQGHSNDVHKLQAQVLDLERSLQEEKERYRMERQRRRFLHNILVELRGNIRVHCRVRPLLPLDRGLSDTDPVPKSSLSEKVIHAINDDTVLVRCTRPGCPPVNKVFEFERVHGPEDSQQTVYGEVSPLLTSLLDGYNVCIMAYGQTGSGKSYTMNGSHSEEEMPHEGIIPRAARELFRLISEKPANSHLIEVSVVEVYNNEVFDLLSKDCDKRDVITTSTGTSDVLCLTYRLVQSAAEILRLINHVHQLRAQNSTLVHTDSSRSHLVVTLTVTLKSPAAMAPADRPQGVQREWWSPRCHKSSGGRVTEDHTGPAPCPRPGLSQSPVRLQLVDLAGSECVGMSGVTGAALRETSFINRSLSALSDVLGALSEHRPHIPYRNSRLTHLLQDSIGGEAKLLVMICVSPSQRFLTESLQSLGFGTRARQVQKEGKRSGATKPK